MTLFTPLMLLFAVSIATVQTTNQEYRISSSVLNCGGERVSSGDFSLQNSIGQPTPIGVCESGGFTLYAGFQPTTIAWLPIEVARRGDVNIDGAINVLDALATVNHILALDVFATGTTPEVLSFSSSFFRLVLTSRIDW